MQGNGTNYRLLRYLGDPVLGDEYHSWGVSVKKGQIAKVTMEQADILLIDFPASWQEVRQMDSRKREYSKDHSKLVSLVMPTFNQAKYLGQALESILEQEYPNWELIVVNDCSTDNTHDVLNKFMDSVSDRRII